MRTFEQLFISKWKWSQKQFGKGYDHNGLIDHIRKELVEIEKNPSDLEEWIDMIFLATDGAARVVKLHYPKAKAEEVVAKVISAFEQKLKINKKRKWGPKVPGKAIEHIREPGPDYGAFIDEISKVYPTTEEWMNRPDDWADHWKK